MPLEFSHDQQRLVGWDTGRDGDLFAEACPGAGKTRAIVGRFLRLAAEEPRKGIALVSFTNAAIDEVKSRCGDRPDALRAPHFVGTFDGFINRYITKPRYVQQYRKSPHFRETWEGVRDASFGMGEPKLPRFELGWFAFDGQLRATLIDDWMPRMAVNALGPFLEHRRDAVEQRAGSLCRQLVRRGTVSCTASRALADGYLGHEQTAQRFGRLLANRFREVIVDEAQDCGPEELRILRLLRQCGVSLVAVADLDQSIFEFRRAGPAGVRAFIDELPGRLAINGNFRSSPAICALNNSLRAGTHVESAAGENAACRLPVQLLEYDKLSAVAATVTGIIEVHEITNQDVIFLAAIKKDAREGAGGRREEAAPGASAVAGIAAAHTVLTSAGSTSAARTKALRRVEGIIRNLTGFEDENDATLDERWLRDAALRLAVSVDPLGIEAKTYAERLRKHVEAAWPRGLTGPLDLGTVLRAPPQSKWLAGSDADQPHTFAWGSIHSVKGREFPAAVLILPKKLLGDDGLTVLDHWERRTASELRRLLYVGASRAQRLLILAVHSTHRDRVMTLLKRDDVLHELV